MSKGRIFTVFLLLFITSCRRVTHDETPPLVKITNPTGGVQANIPSVVRIQAEASDNVMIRSMTIAISRNGQRFTEPLVIPASAKQVLIDTFYPINDRYLEGGSYSLTVTADDGTQTTSDFSPIQIAPYPDSTLGIWVAISNGNSHQLLLLNDSFQPKLNLSLPDIPAGMAYQHRHDNLWLAFRNLNSIKGIRADGGQNWEITSGLQALAQFHPWAGRLEQNFYTCDRNGFVRSRDAFGQINWAWTSPETQSLPYFLYRDQTRLFVGIQPNGNGEPRFKIIHALFSGQLLERTLQMTLNSIQKQDADRYWLFGWQGNDGILGRYQYSTNSWSVVRRLVNEKVTASFTLNAGEVIVATSNGIRRWLTGSESLTTAIPPQGVKQILPLVNQQLLLVNDQSIFRLNGQLLWTAPSGYRIETICELANK